MQLYHGVGEVRGVADQRTRHLEGEEPGGIAETRIVRLIEPLKERRRILLASKEMHQVTQDLEDEIVSVSYLSFSIAFLGKHHCSYFLFMSTAQDEVCIKVSLI